MQQRASKRCIGDTRLQGTADALRLLFSQPGNIVINPSVVRNKAGNAVTPRKFLVRVGCGITL